MVSSGRVMIGAMTEKVSFSRALSSSPAPLMSSGYKLLFPGQGSQYVGMTSSLPSPLPPSIKDLFLKSSDILGYDLRKYCLRGPQEVLSRTIYCQPAVVVGSLAAYRMLDEQIRNEVAGMAGFSVGEITALIAAESMSLEQGLLLVRERARAMNDACLERPSGMLTIIGLEEKALEECVLSASSQTKEPLSIAGHLFQLGYTVGGTMESLKALKSLAVSKGAMSIKSIDVSGAFHSSLMHSAVEKVEEVLDTIDISLPSVPVYSNLSGDQYGSISEIKHGLSWHLVEPVLWHQTMNQMITISGEEGFIEVGPGRQLKTVLRKINKTAFNNCTNVDV